MAENPSIDRIYTADEAAERLRLTTRGLIKLAKKHGHCSRVGRDYLFSESDLLAIWQAIREPPSKTYSVRHVAPAKSAASLFEESEMDARKATLEGRQAHIGHSEVA